MAIHLVPLVLVIKFRQQLVQLGCQMALVVVMVRNLAILSGKDRNKDQAGRI
jgi:hypothetical protein